MTNVAIIVDLSGPVDPSYIPHDVVDLARPPNNLTLPAPLTPHIPSPYRTNNAYPPNTPSSTPYGTDWTAPESWAVRPDPLVAGIAGPAAVGNGGPTEPSWSSKSTSTGTDRGSVRSLPFERGRDVSLPEFKVVGTAVTDEPVVQDGGENRMVGQVVCLKQLYGG